MRVSSEATRHVILPFLVRIPESSPLRMSTLSLNFLSIFFTCTRSSLYCHTLTTHLPTLDRAPFHFLDGRVSSPFSRAFHPSLIATRFSYPPFLHAGSVTNSCLDRGFYQPACPGRCCYQGELQTRTAEDRNALK